MQTQQKQNPRRVQLTAISIVFVLSVMVLASTCPNAASSAPRASATYIIDNQKGKFIAHAFAGGVFWFKGHDHYLAARDFSGEVELTPDSITPASLHLVVKSGSLEETGTVFTDAQKKIINKEVHDLVLLPDKYPDITFQSTSVTAKPAAAGQYDVKIVGNLTLLGVTRQETIPVKLSLSNNDLQAVGEFSIDRDDYKVKATSAFHGFVRVKDKVRFEFDIVAHRR
ncbi:MAG TPA: YceI family protein [Pyrinomonadaceae bacterium]